MGMTKNIKMAMLDMGVKPKELSERMGIKTENLYNIFSKDSMTIKRAELFAEALGCEIVLRNKETGKIY